MRWTVLLIVLALVSPARASQFDGMDNDAILAAVGTAYRAVVAEVEDTATHAGALNGVLRLQAEREILFGDLQKARGGLVQVDDIRLADMCDDTLAYHMGDILIPFLEANPKPILHPGTEKFRAGIANVGFVREWATGFLVNLELKQCLFILADFQAERSAAEVEAAEDAFLRQFGLYCQLYRAQHTELMDLHQCNVTNMEWTVGRVQSETGTSDFVVSNQLFAYRDDGFAYLLKLASPTTGEQMDVFYPLPWMTQLDEGWQELQKQKEAAAGGN